MRILVILVVLGYLSSTAFTYADRAMDKQRQAIEVRISQINSGS